MLAFNRAALAALPLAIAACHNSTNLGDPNLRPDYIKGTIVSTTYDGAGNDLLTAGLGKTGLGSATAPAVAVATAPTVTELRTLAIYNNYRALLDMTPNGGFRGLYGPEIHINRGQPPGRGQ